MTKITIPLPRITALSLAFLLFGAVHRAEALSLAIVASDAVLGSQTEAGLMGTGAFSSVTFIDATTSTPTLSTLSQYDAVLAYTDFPPQDPTGLGNVLASYYDLGGKALTIATYAFSNNWEIGGTVMTGNYAGFTNLGINGNVSGNVVATVPTDPIFDGIDLSQVSFFSNSNYSHPGLAAGATLLATDGDGVDMIARSGNGVIDVNLFPAEDDSPEAEDLLASTLGAQFSAVPEPGTALFGIACTVAVALRRRRKASAV
jgi:hypothetical protein